MASPSGPNYAALGADGGGSYPWTAPLYVCWPTSYTTYFATIAMGAGSVLCNYLKATLFGAVIPTGATIDGIVVTVSRKASANSADANICDEEVKIIKADGSIGSTNKADVSTKWPTTAADVSYGSSTDLWGETWTPADINDADFGVAFKVHNTGGVSSATAYVQTVRITVYYTCANAERRFPTAAVDGGGSYAWHNATNVYANDCIFATENSDSSDFVTNYLKATDFDFNIPAGATINGIVVSIRKGYQGGYSVDSEIKLIKADNSLGTTNKADVSTHYPYVFYQTVISVGSATDLWDLVWTPADINSSNFGVAVRTRTVGGDYENPAVVYVDGISITVYWTPAPAFIPQIMVI